MDATPTTPGSCGPSGSAWSALPRGRLHAGPCLAGWCLVRLACRGLVVREVARFAEAGQQARVGGFPAEGAAGLLGGHRAVQDDHRGQEAEMLAELVRRDAGCGQAQVAADALGDLADRDALVA